MSAFLPHYSLPSTPYSLYIHIPFCKRKCNYCDFVSYAGKEGLIDRYVEALGQELESLPSTFYAPLSTIFFGGGTPTLLEPRHFDKIISTLIGHWSLDIGHSEISVESNPGTADRTKLKALRELGINRLSIGVQSFNDRHLQTLGRVHSAGQAKQFYRDAREAGFDNINLDLMFALPGQTLDEWKRDLDTALTLTTEPPNHLSVYNLQIEEGTPFWEMVYQPSPANTKPSPLSQRERVLSAGTFSHWEKVRVLSGSDEGLKLPSEDEELSMYEHAIETLTAHGYRHYEISNFAKPGFECRHNLVYWRNENYLGVGAGAHSHWNGQRWSNPNCIEQYLETAKFIRRFPAEAKPDRRETLFLGLRLLDGISTEHFAGFEKEVKELTKDGLLTESNGNYKLTRRGLFLGNLVFEKFV